MLKNLSNLRKGIRFPDFYYGWIIVGVGLVSMAFWIGIRSGHNYDAAVMYFSLAGSASEISTGVNSFVHRCHLRIFTNPIRQGRKH